MPQFYLKVHQNTFGESTWGLYHPPHFLAQGACGVSGPPDKQEGRGDCGKRGKGKAAFYMQFYTKCAVIILIPVIIQ